MYRKKKSEAERENWKFCSIRCKTIVTNKNKEKPEQGIKNCVYCNISFTGSVKNYKFVEKSFCSKKCANTYRNKSISAEQRIKINAILSEKAKNRPRRKLTIEQRKRQSERLKGSKSHFWRGGITQKNDLIRESLEYKIWRESIFERDNFTCQICKIRGCNLEADHIKSFAYFPELRFELSNGRTLCKSCHKKTDNYMGRAKRFLP